jgi:hypothetical protein
LVGECRRLSDWEDQYLIGHPIPELSTEHARLLNELERVGTWMSLATGTVVNHPRVKIVTADAKGSARGCPNQGA